MRFQALLVLSATSAIARPQTANPPGSGDNGEMGGIFGMGVTATIPPWASGLGSALSSFASSSGLSSLMGSIDTNALIGKIVPAGPEYPKGKMTLADFYDPGSGPYPAHFITEQALGNHTIYKPKTPPANGIKMPVLIWGNGGCTSSGTPYAPFLTEVASHGYICIANGPPGGAPPSLDLPKEAGGILPGPNGEKIYSKETMTGGNGFAKIKDMLDAIDWVVKGNAAKYGNVDIDNFITAGSSCGGLEAYSAAYHNDRVKLIGVYNSGVLDAKKKGLLKELKAGVAYFQGGPLDPGYANSEADYGMLPQGLPAFKASLDSGHMGTFFTKQGGKYGKTSVALFEWFFRGDQKGKAMWSDPTSSGSMVTEHWNVTHKNFN